MGCRLRSLSSTTPSSAGYPCGLWEHCALRASARWQGYKNPFSLGIIDEHPRAEPARESEPDVVVATAEQVSRIYQHCHVATRPAVARSGCRPVDLFQALVVYLWNVGSRRNDFKALRKEHVRFDLQVIFLRQGKTKKFRPVPMLPVVSQHLRRIWGHPHDRVFPFAANDHELYQQWRAIQQAAGIVVPRPAGSDRLPYFGFHELRKSCLTEFAGISEIAAQQMGAHSKLATTMRHYISATRQQGKLRQAAEQIQQPEAFLKFG